MPETFDQTSQRIAKEQAQKPDRLEPEIAQALEHWVIALMHERRGPIGRAGIFIDDKGRKNDMSYDISEVFAAIYEVAPEAIARMLQSGGASFVR